MGEYLRPDDLILAGCYRARDGARLWEKEVESPVLFFPNTTLAIRAGKLVVTIAGREAVVMLFDLLDGSP